MSTLRPHAQPKEAQAPHLIPLLAPSPANPTASRRLSFARYEDERARNPRTRRQRSCPQPHHSTPPSEDNASYRCPPPRGSRTHSNAETPRCYEGQGQGHDPSCRAYGSAPAQMHATLELDRAHVAPLHPRGSGSPRARRGTRSRHLRLHLHRHNGQEEDSTRELSSSRTRRARRHPREGTYFANRSTALAPSFAPLGSHESYCVTPSRKDEAPSMSAYPIRARRRLIFWRREKETERVGERTKEREKNLPDTSSHPSPWPSYSEKALVVVMYCVLR
ncbi:hypothetical protein B0H13DRAFT_1873740 [Mycena leptocephala]|nr:hypothetical protein B0H13DRAFT_1873740 [Mycena leptocephala]